MLLRDCGDSRLPLAHALAAQIYPGSGYVEDLPLNLSLAKERVAFLRANNWIRPGVRVVLADFQVRDCASARGFRFGFRFG